ncbi:MAG: hypothetical protein AAF821_26710 [Cyanobacteria bacterium P01_D01_bin.156]
MSRNKKLFPLRQKALLLIGFSLTSLVALPMAKGQLPLPTTETNTYVFCNYTPEPVLISRQYVDRESFQTRYERLLEVTAGSRNNPRCNSINLPMLNTGDGTYYDNFGVHRAIQNRQFSYESAPRFTNHFYNWFLDIHGPNETKVAGRMTYTCNGWGDNGYQTTCFTGQPSGEAK